MPKVLFYNGSNFTDEPIYYYEDILGETQKFRQPFTQDADLALYHFLEDAPNGMSDITSAAAYSGTFDTPQGLKQGVWVIKRRPGMPIWDLIPEPVVTTEANDQYLPDVKLNPIESIDLDVGLYGQIVVAVSLRDGITGEHDYAVARQLIQDPQNQSFAWVDLSGDGIPVQGAPFIQDQDDNEQLGKWVDAQIAKPNESGQPYFVSYINYRAPHYEVFVRKLQIGAQDVNPGVLEKVYESNLPLILTDIMLLEDNNGVIPAVSFWCYNYGGDEHWSLLVSKRITGSPIWPLPNSWSSPVPTGIKIPNSEFSPMPQGGCRLPLDQEHNLIVLGEYSRAFATFSTQMGLTIDGLYLAFQKSARDFTLPENPAPGFPAPTSIWFAKEEGSIWLFD